MLFGLSGAIANITGEMQDETELIPGLLLAGVFGVIHVHDQNSDWR